MTDWDKSKGDMKCHYYKDPKDGEKYLIPGCWPVVHSGEIDDCICYRSKITKRRITPNEKVSELQSEVEYWKRKYEELKSNKTIDP